MAVSQGLPYLAVGGDYNAMPRSVNRVIRQLRSEVDCRGRWSLAVLNGFFSGGTLGRCGWRGFVRLYMTGGRGYVPGISHCPDWGDCGVGAELVRPRALRGIFYRRCELDAQLSWLALPGFPLF